MNYGKCLAIVISILICLSLAPVIGNCSASKPSRFVPDLSLLNTYTFDLDGREPFKTPFLAEFQHASSYLYFVAAYHANLTSSPTFQLISRCFKKLPIDAVVLEGFPRAYGFNPTHIIQYYKEGRKGDFYIGGDPAFAGLLAKQRGIPFIGGEPEDKNVCKRLLAKGYSPEDILGFYFVRIVPESKRNHTLETKGVKRAFADCVSWDKPRLGLTTTPFTYNQFKEWYQRRNGASFNAEKLDDDDCAPIAGSKLVIQRISADIWQFRDAYIVQTIASVLDSHKHVLVVYGSSHLSTQRRVLEAMLGKPIRQTNIL